MRKKKTVTNHLRLNITCSYILCFLLIIDLVCICEVDLKVYYVGIELVPISF